jgi:hypothetical protein
MGGSFTKTKCMDRLFKESEGAHALVPVLGCLNKIMKLKKIFFSFLIGNNS